MNKKRSAISIKQIITNNHILALLYLTSKLIEKMNGLDAMLDTNYEIMNISKNKTVGFVDN